MNISVLLPIYNALPYLTRCIESLQSQTVEGIEFICVDDGSTDDSLTYLKSVEQTDSRFRVYHQDNAGYGAAINKALCLATGTYIGIVEPDDFVEPDMFEDLLNLALQHDCDLVKSNRFNHKNDKDTFFEDYSADMCNHVFCPLDEQEIFLKPPVLWSGIYRRSMVEKNNICCLETSGASFQDTGFMFKMHLCAKTAYLTHEAYYHYRRDNENSSVANTTKIFCVNDEYAEMDRFLAEMPEKQEAIRRTYARMRFQTYRWNYKRIDWMFRYAFVLKASEEFRALDLNNAFDKTLFSANEWKRLHQIIESPEAFFQNEIENSSDLKNPIRKISQLEKRIDSLKKSKSYRIGRALTSIPRAIKRKVKSR